MSENYNTSKQLSRISFIKTDITDGMDIREREGGREREREREREALN